MVYLLKQEFYETGSFIYQPGDICNTLKVVSEGEVQVIIKFDTGEERVMDVLKQGSNIGMYSCLCDSPMSFYFKAHGNVTILSLPRTSLEEYRGMLEDLDDALAALEEFI